MKKMTCKEMGGACELVFQAETFEEMVNLSKAHGSEMFKKGDKAHLDVMNAMRELMHKPGAMEKYFAEKKAAFDSMPHE